MYNLILLAGILISLFVLLLIKFAHTTHDNRKNSISNENKINNVSSLASNHKTTSETNDLHSEMKRCPFCGEEILQIAKKCKHCGEFFNESDRNNNSNLNKSPHKATFSLGFKLFLFTGCVCFAFFAIKQCSKRYTELSHAEQEAEKTQRRAIQQMIGFNSKDSLAEYVAETLKEEVDNSSQVKGKGLSCKELVITKGIKDYGGYGLLSDGTRFPVGLKINDDMSYIVKYPIWLQIEKIQPKIKDWVNSELKEKKDISKYELYCTDVVLYKDTEISLKGFALLKDLKQLAVEATQVEDKIIYSCDFSELNIQKLTSPDNSPKFTLDMYNQITDGMTYSDVVNIVGNEGEKFSSSYVDGFTSEIFWWTNSDGSNFNVVFHNNSLIMKNQFGLKLKPNNKSSYKKNFTLDDYKILVKGMSYDEVINILGHEGKLINSSNNNDILTEVYVWENSDGSGFHIEFQEKSINRKSHYGFGK